MEPFTAAIISAVGAGMVSSLGTVVALRVHIHYLRESVGWLREAHTRQEQAISRAHGRIDRIERERPAVC